MSCCQKMEEELTFKTATGFFQCSEDGDLDIQCWDATKKKWIYSKINNCPWCGYKINKNNVASFYQEIIKDKEKNGKKS